MNHRSGRRGPVRCVSSELQRAPMMIFPFWAEKNSFSPSKQTALVRVRREEAVRRIDGRCIFSGEGREFFVGLRER